MGRKLSTIRAAALVCVTALLGAVQARAQAAAEDAALRELMWNRLVQSPPSGRPSVGLALSGGGARGFAHAGVLEALSYAGFPVDRVAGTSMGAVIGGLYASGMSVPEIQAFAGGPSALGVSKDFGGVKFLNLLISDKLITPTYIDSFIRTNLGRFSFEQLKVPFACVAMDFRTGEKVVFSDGPLGTAVRASVNLPGIFAPLEYRHRYLVDGGVVDFVPVDAARQLGADWVLASVTPGASNQLPGNVFLSLLKVIDIQGAMLAGSSEKKADFVIKPEVGEIKLTDFGDCAHAGEAGLAAASGSLDAAREAYLLFSASRLAEKL